MHWQDNNVEITIFLCINRMTGVSVVMPTKKNQEKYLAEKQKYLENDIRVKVRKSSKYPVDCFSLCTFTHRCSYYASLILLTLKCWNWSWWLFVCIDLKESNRAGLYLPYWCSNFTRNGLQRRIVLFKSENGIKSCKQTDCQIYIILFVWSASFSTLMFQ